MGVESERKKEREREKEEKRAASCFCHRAHPFLHAVLCATPQTPHCKMAESCGRVFAYLVLFALTRCRANLLLLGAFGLNVLSTAAVAARASCFFFWCVFSIIRPTPAQTFWKCTGTTRSGTARRLRPGGATSTAVAVSTFEYKKGNVRCGGDIS